MVFMTVLASVLFSLQGGREVSISITQQPRLQMSAGVPCPVFFITSGAIQNGEPMKVFERFSFSRTPSFSKFYIIFLLAPKSDNLITPILSTSTLAHLRSLCIIPFECKYLRPLSICLVYILTSFSSKALYLSSNYLMDPPGTNSNTMSKPLASLLRSV